MMLKVVALLAGTAAAVDFDNLEHIEAVHKACPKVPLDYCGLSNYGVAFLCVKNGDKCEYNAALKGWHTIMKKSVTDVAGLAAVATHNTAAFTWLGFKAAWCNAHKTLGADEETAKKCCDGDWSASYNKCKGTVECSAAKKPDAKCHKCVYDMPGQIGTANTKCDKVTGSYDLHVPKGMLKWNTTTKLCSHLIADVGAYTYKKDACGGFASASSSAARGGVATAAVVLASAVAALLF